MPTINFPKQNVKYYAIQDVYIRSDMATLLQYCSDNGITYVSHKEEPKRFSNDGGLSYQYWGLKPGLTGGTNEWVTEFGFDQIVTELVYS
jgi:hypothetical protein